MVILHQVPGSGEVIVGWIFGRSSFTIACVGLKLDTVKLIGTSA